MSPRRRFPPGLWPLIGLVALGCKAGAGSSEKPGLVIVPAKLELGVLTQNEAVHAEVTLRNLGRSALPLRSSAATTRCRWQGLPKAIAARTTIPLSVVCKSDLVGPLEETLALTLAGATPGDAVATLAIAGRVEPVIGFDTPFVDLRPAPAQTASTDVHLVGKRAAQAVPTIVRTGGDAMKVIALARAAGQLPAFRLSCDGHRVGMHAGSLVVDTGIAQQPQLTLSWGCRVPPTLAVEPANPYFNLHASGDRATTIVVRGWPSGSARFAVRSARVVEGPFHASLEKRDRDGSTRITVRVKNDEIPEDARAVSGSLLIESNDAWEPRKQVPLFGFGKVNKVDLPEAK